MSSLILPLARPLLASLKRKSGHLTRNSSGVRHLSKCGDGGCVICTDYEKTWKVTIADIVTDEKNYTNCSPGVTTSGKRRWGFCELPTLNIDVNATHSIFAALMVGTVPCIGAGLYACATASGAKSIDVDGRLYLSGVVSDTAPKPAFGTFSYYDFTLTVNISFIIYDYCGSRYAGVYIQPGALSYDDTYVSMELTGNMVILFMDFAERAACGTLPLVGDDVWFNSTSFGGNGIIGSMKSDSPTNTWKAGSRYIATVAMVSGSAGSYFSATQP